MVCDSSKPFLPNTVNTVVPAYGHQQFRLHLVRIEEAVLSR